MLILTATQQPEPIVVDVLSDGSTWWEPLVAFAPFVVALVALGALWQRSIADAKALSQRQTADDRSEWWRRTQWALDAAFSSDPARRKAGIGALRILAESSLATDEELAVLDAVWIDDPEVAPDRGKWSAGRLVEMGRHLTQGNRKEGGR
ncbi:hypothetical protein [Arthrobacter agilis]|uniref:hypothetical protein n=1 Tax=Arthrobacter agilis TaxID=37921 RepID=UPI0027869A98|nr:hypothetical protein [Arthrobacter agilis]MDQ0734657.1 hypothetical protein [Arthrobacter agilis]